MFCKNCGQQVPDESKFCLHCGANLSINETDEAAKDEPKAALKNSGKAIAGFVLSLVSVVVGGYDLVSLLLAISCAVIGLVFSTIGRQEIMLKKKKGKGFAIAGLVISIVVLSLSALDLLSYTFDMLFWQLY